MIHETTIKKYDGTLKDLANDIGDLQYDALVEFLEQLALKIAKDGGKDRARGRMQLATCLEKSAESIGESAKEIAKAWIICEPYMKKPESAAETKLIAQIKEILAPQDQSRLEELEQKQFDSTLNEVENKEMESLIERLEKLHFQRILAIGQLAQLRGQSVEVISKEFGFKA